MISEELVLSATQTNVVLCVVSSCSAEAIHIGSLIAAQGYTFPISDHVLTLKDDGTFYRFQVRLPHTDGSLVRAMFA